MLHDELEMYSRGDTDAPRPGVLPAAVRRRQQLDARLPEGVRDPASATASAATPRRTASSSGCCSTTSRSPSSSATTGSSGQTFEEGSYVVWIAQPRRGLLDTAMSIGVDISDRIGILYAPPAAWSHGYLWGADVVTVDDGDRFTPKTTGSTSRTSSRAASSPGRARPRATCSRSTRRPPCGRSTRSSATASTPVSRSRRSAAAPAGTAVFGADRATERALDDVGRDSGLDVPPPAARSAPPLEPIDARAAVPRDHRRQRRPSPTRAPGCCASSASSADPITLQQLRRRPPIRSPATT